MRLAVRSNSLLSLPFPATVALLAFGIAWHCLALLGNAWSTGRVCCCFCWHHQPPTPTLMQNRLRTSSTLPFAHLNLHIAQQHGYFPLNKKRNYCMTIGNAHYRQLSHVNFGCTSDDIDVSRFICLHSSLYTFVSSRDSNISMLDKIFAFNSAYFFGQGLHTM